MSWLLLLVSPITNLPSLSFTILPNIFYYILHFVLNIFVTYFWDRDVFPLCIFMGIHEAKQEQIILAISSINHQARKKTQRKGNDIFSNIMDVCAFNWVQLYCLIILCLHLFSAIITEQ